MNYTPMKVRDVMQKISGNEIYLPAIQRKFVWGPRKIEALFDSIMRGYPIGTFLFWFVEGKTKNDYTFYKFIQDFDERRVVNEVAPAPHLGERFIGVLDGQQRLNSMYVALQGSYAYPRKYARRNNNAACPPRWLYLNLFHEPADDDESGIQYQFSFLTVNEARAVDGGQYWFRVKDALDFKDASDVFRAITGASARYPEHAERLFSHGASMLTLLWQRLCSDDVISYFRVNDQELDRIVDIFIRVNSAGVQLSKTDLLFSSIVAHWNEGRAEIENAIETLNEKGSGFSFDNDFVMRTCLVLTDLPVLFKVNSFKQENIERIRNQWPQIRQSLETAVDLLVEWGFSRETLSTLNAVIPIAYFIHKGGDVRASREVLRQYLLRALLNQIFGSATDRVLSFIRDYLRDPSPHTGDVVLRTPVLSLGDLLNMPLPNERTLRIRDEKIEDLLSTKKGPHTFMVLSLLYPHLKFEQVQFHQDHLHPWSQFSAANLKSLGASEDEIARWQEDRDRLPNLQLLEGAENKSKNAMPLEGWVEAHGDPALCRFANCIPASVSLKLEDFEEFYTARKELLRRKLQAILVA